MSEKDTLLKDSKDKSLKIIELQNIIRRQGTELKKKDDEIKSLQTLLRERTQRINKLSIDYFRMQQQVVSLRNIQVESLVQAQKIAQLQQIIRLQTEQIHNYLEDQQRYVMFVEEFYNVNKDWVEERGLLYEYRQELERQIEDVQNINQRLICQSEQYGTELYKQNEQANDLLGQIQYIVECCEGVE